MHRERKSERTRESVILSSIESAGWCPIGCLWVRSVAMAAHCFGHLQKIVLTCSFRLCCIVHLASYESAAVALVQSSNQSQRYHQRRSSHQL